VLGGGLIGVRFVWGVSIGACASVIVGTIRAEISKSSNDIIRVASGRIDSFRQISISSNVSGRRIRPVLEVLSCDRSGQD
jgi:hypothetical protein